MTHPEHETLVALVDGELPADAQQQTAQHLERCADCAAAASELTASAAMFAAALQRVDASEPTGWAESDQAVAAIRRRSEMLPRGPFLWVTPEDLPQKRVRSRPERSALRWAAGLLLVSGVAAAAIVTPGLIERIVQDGAPVVDEPRTPVSGGAVAVAPAAGAVSIALSNAAEGTRVEIAFHAGAEATVDYFGRVAPRFVARDGHIAVDLAGESMMLRVSLPADLRLSRITLDGEEVALIERGSIVSARTDTGVAIVPALNGT